MPRITFLILIALSGLGLQAALAAEGDVVFRSDVALARVDAQVVDRDNRAITGLRAEDFILRENGQPREIRNFASEDMPVDVVLLLDVSGSMRPHVERISAAAHNALQVLGDNDRVAIMVFDQSTRLRLPFRNSREDVERGLELLLRQETFDGGTDITRGLLDAAQYVGREGRRDARRAVVILTDDQTGGHRDEAGVSRALVRADSVLSALIAPDAMQGRYGQQGGGYPRRRGSGYPGGSSWPGGGIGGTLGGIILGRGGPYGGGMPGPVVIGGGPRMQSAGTSEIARQSGGDSMPVDDAAALETTLSRIRQRYALHYYLPEGEKPGEQRNLQVDLADSARRRYRDAEVRFRQVYMAGGTDAGSPGSSAPVVVTRAPANYPSRPDTDSSADPDRPRLRRRPASNEPDGSRPSITTADRAGTSTAQAPVDSTAKPNGGWRRVDEPAGAPGPAATPAPAPAQEPRSGGWRKLKPGEQP